MFALPLVAAAGVWKTVTPTAQYTSRSDCAFGVCGNTLCLLGGRSLPYPPKPASVYDTARNTWTNGAAPPVDMHHFQIAEAPGSAAGCVWAGGAFNGYFPAEGTVGNIYQFCPGGRGTWTVGPKIARPRGAGGAFTYRGKYYLVGGNVGGHGRGSSVKDWFDAYDPATKMWSILPPIPHPRDHFFAVVMENRLYVIGGRNGAVAAFFDATVPAVDVYDFFTNRWSTLSAQFPVARGGAAAALHGNRIVIGGGEGKNAAFTDVHLFDGRAFTRGPSLLTPHHGTGFASCNGGLWIAGGVSAQGGYPEVRSTEVLVNGQAVPLCTAATQGSPGLIV
jgi:hypothetical protein